MAGLKQLNWASEGVGATAAALVDLSTVAGNKISNPPWVKFQSAGWVNFPSAPTIHALLDTTGSPIYDGRVGAAIALLYHLYRQGTGTTASQALDFAWGPGIGDQIRNPQDLKLGYNGTPRLSTTSRHLWARRQLQLGWIIRAVLEGSELFAKQPHLVDRCHAFEAGLFMMGYDLRSLVPDGYTIPVPPKPNYRVRRMTRAT